ncbi:hypothetical protein D3C81_1292660 [compost metagenome]
MQVVDQWPQIVNLAVGVGILQQRPEHLMLFQVIHSVDDQLETEAFGAGLKHRNGLWMAVFIDEKQIALRLRHTFGECHGFGSRRRFIEQRSVGQLEAGEVDGQLLEIQQRFEPALSDLRLIRRVRGVPAGIFQHIAQDDGWRQCAVVAHTDQAGPDLILLGVTGELGQCGLFIQGRRQVE